MSLLENATIACQKGIGWSSVLATTSSTRFSVKIPTHSNIEVGFTTREKFEANRPFDATFGWYFSCGKSALYSHCENTIEITVPQDEHDEIIINGVWDTCQQLIHFSINGVELDQEFNNIPPNICLYPIVRIGSQHAQAKLLNYFVSVFGRLLAKIMLSEYGAVVLDVPGENQTKSQRSLLAHSLVHQQNAQEVRCLPQATAQRVQTAISASILINIALAIAKTYAAIVSGSLAVLSSLVDSILDLTSQALFWFTDRYMHTPNENYPAGRRRLEPIAVVVSATLMGMASLEVVQKSIGTLIEGFNGIIPELFMSILTISVLIFAIVVKLLLWFICSQIAHVSPSAAALAQDHRNDVFSNSIAVITSVIAHYRESLWFLDPIGAILISVYITWSWVETGKEQVDRLVGLQADEDFIERIRHIIHFNLIGMTISKMTSYGSVDLNDENAAVVSRSQRSLLAHSLIHRQDDIEEMVLPVTTSRQVQFAIGASLVVNVLLTIVKTYCAIQSGSLAVLSSLVDSILDLASQGLFWWTDRYMHMPDPAYPAGRRRLEPIAVIVSATLMGMASLEVVQQSIATLIQGLQGKMPDLYMSNFTIIMLGVAIVIKLVLWFICAKIAHSSPSAAAVAQDHRNDVFSNTVALATSLLAHTKPSLWYTDPAGGIFISIYIAWSWLATGREQVDRLIGLQAGDEFINSIRSIADTHHPNMQADIVRAYHFGNNFLVELEVILPGEMTVYDSHDISLALQKKVEELDQVERAFVHVDYAVRVKLKLPGRSFVSYDNDLAAIKVSVTATAQDAIDAIVLATDASSPVLTVSMPGYTASPELQFLAQVSAPSGLFNQIECAGSGACIVENGVLNTTEDVSLTASGAGNFLVSTDDLLLRFATVEASGAGDFQWTTGRFVSQQLNVNHHGSGAVAFQTTGELLPGQLSTKVDGAGSVFYSGNAFNALQITSAVSGSGNINFLPSGVCGNHSISSTGSGNVYAGGIDCDNTDVFLGGVGSAYVEVINTLTTTITGSGSVQYVDHAPAIKNATTTKSEATEAASNVVEKLTIYQTPSEVIAAIGTPKPVSTPAHVLTQDGSDDTAYHFSYLWFFLALAVILMASLAFLKRYMDKKRGYAQVNYLDTNPTTVKDQAWGLIETLQFHHRDRHAERLAEVLFGSSDGKMTLQISPEITWFLVNLARSPVSMTEAEIDEIAQLRQYGQEKRTIANKQRVREQEAKKALVDELKSLTLEDEWFEQDENCDTESIWSDDEDDPKLVEEPVKRLNLPRIQRPIQVDESIHLSQVVIEKISEPEPKFVEEYAAHKPWLFYEQYQIALKEQKKTVLSRTIVLEEQLVDDALSALMGILTPTFISTDNLPASFPYISRTSFWKSLEIKHFEISSYGLSLTVSHLTPGTLYGFLQKFMTMATSLACFDGLVAHFSFLDNCPTLQGFAHGLREWTTQCRFKVVSVQIACRLDRHPTLIQAFTSLENEFEQATWLYEWVLQLFTGAFSQENPSLPILSSSIISQMATLLEQYSILYQERPYSLLTSLFTHTLQPYVHGLYEYVRGLELPRDMAFTLQGTSAFEILLFASIESVPTVSTVDPPKFLLSIISLILETHAYALLSTTLHSTNRAFTTEYGPYQLSDSPVVVMSDNSNQFDSVMHHTRAHVPKGFVRQVFKSNSPSQHSWTLQLDNSLPVISFEKVLEQSLLDPLRDHCLAIGHEFARQFVDDFKIQDHLVVLQWFVLQQQTDASMHFCNGLFTHLFSNVHRSRWLEPYTMNVLFQEALNTAPDIYRNDTLTDQLSIRVNSSLETSVVPTIQWFDQIQFCYEAPLPMHLIFREDTINRYSRLGVFSIQLQGVERYIVQFKHQLRHRRGYFIAQRELHHQTMQLGEMLHFVQKIHSYAGQVMAQEHWDAVNAAIISAKRVSEMSDTIESCLNGMLERCFLQPKHRSVHQYIIQLLHHIVNYVVHFDELIRDFERDLNELKASSTEVLSALASKFKMGHGYLMIILKAMYQTGSAPHLHHLMLDLNFNGYYDEEQGE
ncbi:Cation Diffusion Facilitator (CDF) Family [Thraustotheca clavata]|uniref:Cation Diffusion Facilitator (CDF) Family n=1 Tax=Thraustotheca clavata TaxID=74557 RepID=A0A1V9ZXY8_9STRA|nr:Cation Diffusion Facilitator (CDF) Family [Thraustotheca clavata]